MNADNPFTVFVSSPGGLDNERAIVAEEVERVSTEASQRGTRSLAMVRWPQEIGSGAADYSQQVINRQTLVYDILLCIVGVRIGTPTPRASSGTEEELDRAIDAVLRGEPVQVLAFFSNLPTRPSAIDPYQLMLVQAFREKVARLGVLYHVFDDLVQFRQRVRTSLLEAHRRLVAGEPPAFIPTAPSAAPPPEIVPLGNLVLRRQTTAPQWADAHLIPLARYRHRAIRLTGRFFSPSPYFRFGFKYFDEREPLFSAGSIQTQGQNVLVHIGRNHAQTPLFVTSYRAGYRLDRDRPLERTQDTGECSFVITIDRSGNIEWTLDGRQIYRTFYPIDGHPQLALLAWGDEHDFCCEMSDLTLSIGPG